MQSNSTHPSPDKLWIKICGFTDPENAKTCAAFKPDAMGLVFFEKSPRNVSIDTARRITDILPETIMSVGVFVNKNYDEIMHIADHCRLKGVQLHGSESADLANKLLKNNLHVIKALFAKKDPCLDQAEDYSMVSSLLVEYGKGTLPGGNAESWNYEISSQMKTQLPIILAGGLGPDTITDVLKKAQPAGVDVSSGVELSYGMKDPDKVKLFISRVRSFTH
jgi:phosphoribosylanthranilate isomerase